MPKYVIERDLPGAGQLPDAELQAISKHSCNTIESLNHQVIWQQSYVTDDKIFCVYIAPNEEAVREHAEKGKFPCTRINKVSRVIDPSTAE